MPPARKALDLPPSAPELDPEQLAIHSLNRLYEISEACNDPEIMLKSANACATLCVRLLTARHCRMPLPPDNDGGPHWPLPYLYRGLPVDQRRAMLDEAYNDFDQRAEFAAWKQSKAAEQSKGTPSASSGPKTNTNVSSSLPSASSAAPIHPDPVHQPAEQGTPSASSGCGGTDNTNANASSDAKALVDVRQPSQAEASAVPDDVDARPENAAPPALIRCEQSVIVSSAPGPADPSNQSALQINAEHEEAQPRVADAVPSTESAKRPRSTPIDPDSRSSKLGVRCASAVNDHVPPEAQHPP